MLAHISTECYARLEQGRASRPPGEVLASIVGALRLTDAEAHHLHLLAGTAPTRAGCIAFRQHVALELRAAHARYPSDPAITSLVEELRDGSPEFARLWARHDVEAATMLSKTFRHPVVGTSPSIATLRR